MVSGWCKLWYLISTNHFPFECEVHSELSSPSLKFSYACAVIRSLAFGAPTPSHPTFYVISVLFCESTPSLPITPTANNPPRHQAGLIQSYSALYFFFHRGTSSGAFFSRCTRFSTGLSE